MVRMRYLAIVLAATVGLGAADIPALGQQKAGRMILAMTGSVLQDVSLLLRLAPLQLTAEQLEGILQVLEAGTSDTAQQTWEDLEQLRQRLLRGEQPTGADVQLYRQGYREIRALTGDAAATTAKIRALLTPEQLTALARGGFGLVPRRDVKNEAQTVILSVLEQTVKDLDEVKKRQQGDKLLKAVNEAGDGQLEEAKLQDLRDFLDRVLAMDEAEFAGRKQELLAETELLVPAEVDAGKLYLAMYPERVEQQIGILFMSGQAQSLLRDMLQANAGVQ